MKVNLRNIKELESRKAELVAENSALIGKDGMTEAERATFDANARELAIVKGAIDGIHAQWDVERKAPRVGDDPRPSNSQPRYTGGRKFRDLFPEAVGTGGFSNLNEYLSLIQSGLNDPRLIAAVGSEGVPSEGGFLVPAEFAAEMLDKALEDEIVRPRATIFPMTSKTKKIAGVDVSSPNSAFGGSDTEWIPENGTGTARVLKLRTIELNTRKLAMYAAASSELVADGLSYEEQLSDALIKALSWNLDYAFLRGSGAEQPLGVLNDPSLITVSKETGQLAATVTYQNLVDLFARLHPACVGTSVFVANTNVIPQLLTMGLVLGTSGTPVPVLRESDGGYSVLTRPILFTEKLPALGAKGDVLLADFSQYRVGLRKEVSIEKSLHVGWLNDQTNYRAILRADGQGSWAKAYTPKAGSTLSWCVTLEARA